MTASFHPWTLEAIDAFLVEHGGTVLVKDGSPLVQFPKGPDRERLLATLLPHLKARKADLLEWLYRTYPVLFNAPESGSNVQPEQTAGAVRRKLIDAARARARDTNRACYFLKRNGRPVVDGSKEAKAVTKTYKVANRKVVIPIDREASHVCVEGDKEWTPLPKITSKFEDRAFLTVAEVRALDAKKWDRSGRSTDHLNWGNADE